MNKACRSVFRPAGAGTGWDTRHMARVLPAVGGLMLALSVVLPASARHHGEEHDAAPAHHAEAPPAASGVVVKGGYTFAPRPGVPNIGVYFEQVSNGSPQADQLVAAQTPIGRRTELHVMKMDGQVMHMKEVSGIELPAHGSVDMGKGAGYHIMVMGLDKPLKAGDRFPLTLRFRDAGEQTVQVEVREAGKAGRGSHHDHGSHGHKH